MSINEIAENIIPKLTKQARRFDVGVLVIMVGLPYSGKSTIAESLAPSGFVHFWATIIRKECNLSDDEMVQVAVIVITKLLRNGHRIAFDFINHTEIVRSKFIRIANNMNVDWKIVYVDTDIDELHRRRREVSINGASIGRSDLPIGVIERIASEMQEPENNDDVIRVKDGDLSDLEKWIVSLI